MPNNHYTRFIELFFGYNRTTGDIDFNEIHKYIIPVYQRTYRWDENICKMFIMDLLRLNGRGSEEYNFGLITMSNSDDYIHELIDGQQRMISFYLIVMAYYKYLKEISSVENFIKINSFYQADLPFSGNEEISRNLCKLKTDISNNVKINGNSIIESNFVTFYEFIAQHYRNQESGIILSAIDDFQFLYNNKVVKLEYNNMESALDSFIAINMKNRPLDSFEVFSALILKYINNDNRNEYRLKLNQLYSSFQKLDNKKAFISFEYYLRYLIRTQKGKYEYYSEGTKNERKEKIEKEVITNMPNHYVVKFLNTHLNAVKFVEESLLKTDILVDLLNYGKIEKILENIELLNNENDTIDSLEKQIKYIYHDYSGQKDNKNSFVTAHIQYIMAVLSLVIYDINNDSLTFVNVKRYLIDLIMIGVEHHVISVVGLSDIKKDEYLSFISVPESRKLRKLNYDNTDDEYVKEIFTVRKLDERNSYHIIKAKALKSLIVLYQLKSSINNRNERYNNEIVRVNVIDKFNKEHLYFDQSRCNNILTLKNLMGFNCINLDKQINDQFAENNYKNINDKLIFIRNKPINWKKDYQLYSKLFGIIERSISELRISEASEEIRNAYFSNENVVCSDELIDTHINLVKDVSLKLSQNFKNILQYIDYSENLFQR